MRYRNTILTAIMLTLTGTGVLLGAPDQAAIAKAQAAQVSSPQAAVEVGQDWLNALVAQDPAKACTLMDASVLAQFTAQNTTCEAQMARFASDPATKGVVAGYAAKGLSVSSAVVTGKTAYLPVDVQHAMTLNLTDAGWRVANLT